jgi:hypothetical protein
LETKKLQDAKHGEMLQKVKDIEVKAREAGITDFDALSNASRKSNNQGAQQREKLLRDKRIQE